jgi:hypothetical protein
MLARLAYLWLLAAALVVVCFAVFGYVALVLLVAATPLIVAVGFVCLVVRLVGSTRSGRQTRKAAAQRARSAN